MTVSNWSEPGAMLHTESQLVSEKSKFFTLHLKKAKQK